MSNGGTERLSLRGAVRLFTWFLLALSVIAQRIAKPDSMGEFFSNSISPSLWAAGIVLQAVVIALWVRKYYPVKV